MAVVKQYKAIWQTTAEGWNEETPVASEALAEADLDTAEAAHGGPDWAGSITVIYASDTP